MAVTQEDLADEFSEFGIEIEEDDVIHKCKFFKMLYFTETVAGPKIRPNLLFHVWCLEDWFTFCV